MEQMLVEASKRLTPELNPSKTKMTLAMIRSTARTMLCLLLALSCAEAGAEVEERCMAMPSPPGWEVCTTTKTGTGLWLEEATFLNEHHEKEFSIQTAAEVNAAFLRSSLRREVTIEDTPLGLLARTDGSRDGEAMEGDPLIDPSARLCRPHGDRKWQRCSVTAGPGSHDVFWLWWQLVDDEGTASAQTWVGYPSSSFRLCAASSGPAAVTIAASGGQTWSRMNSDDGEFDGSSHPAPYCTSIQQASMPNPRSPDHLSFLAVWSTDRSGLPSGLEIEPPREDDGQDVSTVLTIPWTSAEQRHH